MRPLSRCTIQQVGHAESAVSNLAQELGVEDAIDKMYLKQLLMAIYLDPDHPTDIVECYTFSFSYSADGQGQAVRLPLRPLSAL